MSPTISADADGLVLGHDRTVLDDVIGEVRLQSDAILTWATSAPDQPW